jgi:N-acetylglutamate synthase-like GNAT family acetyltransferase
MAIKLIDYGTPEYLEMVKLRQQILRTPLGLTYSDEELEAEKNEILIGFYDDDILEGCCMLIKIDDQTVRLRQIAVISGLQGKGIGKVLTTFAENIARDRGYKKMIMHARKSSIGFFEKFGFHISSSEFQELTIPHCIMEKDL